MSLFKTVPCSMVIGQTHTHFCDVASCGGSYGNKGLGQTYVGRSHWTCVHHARGLIATIRSCFLLLADMSEE